MLIQETNDRNLKSDTTPNMLKKNSNSSHHNSKKKPYSSPKLTLLGSMK